MNAVERMNRSDQRSMAITSLLLVAVSAYVAYRFELLRPFHPANALLFWLSILWFCLSAVETFNKRMGQIEMRGGVPPYMEYRGLHTPISVAQYGLLAWLLILNWQWALTLYWLKLMLAVSPVLRRWARFSCTSG